MRKRFAHGRLKGNRSENPGQSRCCVPPLLLNLDKKPLHCCREGIHVSGPSRGGAIARREILSNLKLRGMDFLVFNAPRRALED